MVMPGPGKRCPTCGASDDLWEPRPLWRPMAKPDGLSPSKAAYRVKLGALIVLVVLATASVWALIFLIVTLVVR